MTHDELTELIVALERDIKEIGTGGANWKAVWERIKSVSASFKRIRYPEPEDRNIAWARFQCTVELLKQKQNNYFARREEQERQSGEHLARLERYARDADPDDGEWLVKAIAFVASGGLTFVVEKGLDALLGERDEVRESLQKRSEAIKEGWAYLSGHKAEMIGPDKAKVFARLTAAKERLDTDWAAWKAAKQAQFEQRRDQRAAKQAEWEEKQARWRAGQETFIARLEGDEETLEAAEARREQHLGSLLEKVASARSDDFRERVESWIDEERDNLVAIRRKLEDVRAKLRDARSKLSQ